MRRTTEALNQMKMKKTSSNPSNSDQRSGSSKSKVASSYMGTNSKQTPPHHNRNTKVISRQNVEKEDSDWKTSSSSEFSDSGESHNIYSSSSNMSGDDESD